jgi:hypothetical protein
MYRGYVKLWRKLEDSQIFQNEKALKIWIWILIRANHKENTVMFGRQKILIHKGEFIMGLNKASEHLNLAKSTIHFWVNYLKDLGKVELKKTNKYTIIKINNWEDYQETETQTELQKNSKKTLKETNKNDKDIIKNDKEVIVSEQSSQIQEIFKIFYETINRNINFGNKTQRKAVEDMIRLQGFERVKKVAEFACQIHGQQYAPVITTPLQLRDKWSQLEAWGKTQVEKSNSKGITII